MYSPAAELKALGLNRATRTDMRQRLQSGLAIIIWPIVACCAIAILAFAFDSHRAPRPGEPSLPELLAFYISAGLMSGVVIGLLQPFAKSPVGRILIAAIAALPVTAGIILMSEDWHWQQVDRIDIGVAVALAMVFGPFAMAYGRIRMDGERPDSEI